MNPKIAATIATKGTPKPTPIFTEVLRPDEAYTVVIAGAAALEVAAVAYFVEDLVEVLLAAAVSLDSEALDISLEEVMVEEAVVGVILAGVSLGVVVGVDAGLGIMV